MKFILVCVSFFVYVLSVPVDKNNDENYDAPAIDPNQQSDTFPKQNPSTPDPYTFTPKFVSLPPEEWLSMVREFESKSEVVTCKWKKPTTYIPPTHTIRMHQYVCGDGPAHLLVFNEYGMFVFGKPRSNGMMPILYAGQPMGSISTDLLEALGHGTYRMEPPVPNENIAGHPLESELYYPDQSSFEPQTEINGRADVISGQQSAGYNSEEEGATQHDDTLQYSTDNSMGVQNDDQEPAEYHEAQIEDDFQHYAVENYSNVPSSQFHDNYPIKFGDFDEQEIVGNDLHYGEILDDRSESDFDESILPAVPVTVARLYKNRGLETLPSIAEESENDLIDEEAVNASEYPVQYAEDTTQANDDIKETLGKKEKKKRNREYKVKETIPAAPSKYETEKQKKREKQLVIQQKLAEKAARRKAEESIQKELKRQMNAKKMEVIDINEEIQKSSKEDGEFSDHPPVMEPPKVQKMTKSAPSLGKSLHSKPDEEKLMGRTKESKRNRNKPDLEYFIFDSANLSNQKEYALWSSGIMSPEYQPLLKDLQFLEAHLRIYGQYLSVSLSKDDLLGEFLRSIADQMSVDGDKTSIAFNSLVLIVKIGKLVLKKITSGFEYLENEFSLFLKIMFEGSREKNAKIVQKIQSQTGYPVTKQTLPKLREIVNRVRKIYEALSGILNKLNQSKQTSSIGVSKFGYGPIDPEEVVSFFSSVDQMTKRLKFLSKWMEKAEKL